MMNCSIRSYHWLLQFLSITPTHDACTSYPVAAHALHTGHSFLFRNQLSIHSLWNWCMHRTDGRAMMYDVTTEHRKIMKRKREQMRSSWKKSCACMITGKYVRVIDHDICSTNLFSPPPLLHTVPNILHNLNVMTMMMMMMILLSYLITNLTKQHCIPDLTMYCSFLNNFE